MSVSETNARSTPALDRRGSRLGRPQFLRAEVQRVTEITPRFRRVTIAGEGLAGFPETAPAAKVRLFLPAPGCPAPDFPTWSQLGLLWPPGNRTVMRSYTLRRHEPGSDELDVDMLLHGKGPGAQWAAAARPGAPLGLLPPEPGYVPRPDTDLHQLIGDEAALPAIASIVEGLPAGAGRLVVVEVGHHSHLRYLEARGVRWLLRGDESPGAALTRYVRALLLPGQGLQAFVAAEATPTRLIREHLTRACWLDARAGDLYAKGYWKAGD